MTFEQIAALAKEADELLKAHREAELDKRIADRSQDSDAIERTTIATGEALNAWHRKYMEGGDALTSLCMEHGIDKSLLRQFL